MEEQTNETGSTFEPKQTGYIRRILFTLILTALILGPTYLHLISSPLKSEQVTFTVDQGLSVKGIAEKAEAEGVIRSSFLLYLLLTTFHDPTTIHAGQYAFSEQDTVNDIAKKLADSNTVESLVRVTFPEGFTAEEFALIAEKVLPEFSEPEYLVHAGSSSEGYLFPETYFVPEWYTAEDIFDLQRETFIENVTPVIEISEQTLTEYEVLTLASIIEREANSKESMEMVASVLLNRLAVGMPLQTDASVEYVINKPLSELTPEDLKIDSPYNTYLNPGLPPTPIGNPGLTSINAVLDPTETDYFYYITDGDGEFHFAKTLQGHNQNINRYLR